MIPSYHDLNNENSYHMMMLGMCLCLSDNYKVIYNREEGKGRCDLIIQAHDEKKTSFIIEFKYFKEDKKILKKHWINYQMKLFNKSKIEDMIMI